MTPERRKFVVLSSLILCGMLVCGFFMLRHSPHHSAFSLAFSVLLFINAWLMYSRSDRRMPDTLIHLFPGPPQTPQKEPNS
jgi:hypothetical protein